jgi:hypothetical protein
MEMRAVEVAGFDIWNTLTETKIQRSLPLKAVMRKGVKDAIEKGGAGRTRLQMRWQRKSLRLMRDWVVQVLRERMSSVKKRATRGPQTVATQS